jgi:glycosyltransferase involved in cell wall biosynthesis
LGKKILILSEYLISEKEGAAFERLSCYIKAVPEVDFYIFNPNLDYTRPIAYKNDSDSQNLYFAMGEMKKTGFIYRNSLAYFSFYRSFMLCAYIFRNFNKSEVKILLYSSLLPLFYWVMFYLKRKSFFIITEKNEIENGILNNVSFSFNYKMFFFILIFPFRYLGALLVDSLTKKADKVIAISTRIRDRYYNQTVCHYIPILVDTDRFERSDKKLNSTCIKFVHLGSITKKKDGIEELILSINRIKGTPLNFHLDIIGNISSNFSKRINRYILKNNLSEFITIKNSVKSDMVPAILKDYDYGFLIRERNTQTQYGFSTKLGVYLASGIPVVYTDVSDNLLFLEDNIHGFLVPFPMKKNLPVILEKAIKVDFIVCKEMKENARKLALEKFDYRNYSEILRNTFA